MPITGYDQKERFSEAYTLANSLKDAFINAEIITPFHCCPFGVKLSYGECMKRCIKELMNADMVIFADGWEESRGCKAEMEVAKACEIEYYIFADISKKEVNEDQSTSVK